jgi:cytochrome c oxidase cbb3-type subunit 3
MTKENRPEGDHPIEGHDYDGIVELDNSLPRWWLNSFYLTIVFAAGYFTYYTTGDGPTLVTEYEHVKNDYEIVQISKKKNRVLASEEELRAFLKEPLRVKAGQTIFQDKCMTCHGAQGQGGIGPNLTDDYWIHGGKMTDILNTVLNGVLDKGMPPWEPILKQDEIYSVVAYVKSMRGSKPAGAKAPQGELTNQ